MQALAAVSHDFVFDKEVIEDFGCVEDSLIKWRGMRRGFSPNARNVHLFRKSNQLVKDDSADHPNALRSSSDHTRMNCQEINHQMMTPRAPEVSEAQDRGR